MKPSRDQLEFVLVSALPDLDYDELRDLTLEVNRRWVAAMPKRTAHALSRRLTLIRARQHELRSTRAGAAEIAHLERVIRQLGDLVLAELPDEPASA